MTELEKKANIEDKRRFYEEAREKALKYANLADEAERLAAIQREHAKRFAERQNEALKALNEAMA